jgi:phosphoribosyl 1,2-cyclic phosphodiesterase
MVSRQLAASGGIWLELNGTSILIDPGPGCIVQSTQRKLNTEKLSAIVLSHRHLDHAADVNVMIEAMTNGGHNRHGRLFAPGDSFGKEPVLFSYLRKFIDGITSLEAEKEYQAGNITFSTSARHDHPVETYGLIFRGRKHTFAYLTDTKYFDGLSKSYTADLLVINMVLTEPRPAIYHLSIPDVERIVKEVNPQVAILNHFGMHVWELGPARVAAQMAEKTGCKVIAARDGMIFDLETLEEV